MASQLATVRDAYEQALRVSTPPRRVASPGPPGGKPEVAGASGLEKEIEAIERLSLDDLRVRWRNLSGRLAPPHLSRGLLARILAYRMQAQAFGDLDRSTVRALDHWGEPAGRDRVDEKSTTSGPAGSVDASLPSERRASEPLTLKLGTLLTREWQGRMETVMVVADGFAWNGEIFASPSAVAQAITGTKWNGHRFFGVRPQDRSGRGFERGSDPAARLEDDSKVRIAGPGSLRKRVSTQPRAGLHEKGAGP